MSIGPLGRIVPPAWLRRDDDTDIRAQTGRGFGEDQTAISAVAKGSVAVKPTIIDTHVTTQAPWEGPARRGCRGSSSSRPLGWGN